MILIDRLQSCWNSNKKVVLFIWFAGPFSQARRFVFLSAREALWPVCSSRVGQARSELPLKFPLRVVGAPN
jgi:hypothetical protein